MPKPPEARTAPRAGGGPEESPRHRVGPLALTPPIPQPDGVNWSLRFRLRPRVSFIYDSDIKESTVSLQSLLPRPTLCLWRTRS